MDKKYIELFKELTRATAVSAEQVMDYDKAKKDEQGYNTAMTMRDDFEELNKKITAKEFDGTLSKADFAKLLVGCYVTLGTLQSRKDALEKAIAGYQTDLMPKLDKILKSESDEDAMSIANEEFIIRETNT